MSGYAHFFTHPSRPQGWSLRLEHPSRVLCAMRIDEIEPALRVIDEATRTGQWAALMLAYEAAPAFDSALETHAPDGFPLLWAGIYEQPAPAETWPPVPPEAAYQLGCWRPLVSRPRYDAAVCDIRELIRRGEAYQVNYAIPFEAASCGDAQAWLYDLAQNQRAGYAAYLDIGEYSILSLSPELFFRRDGARVTTRPMKGTMARGRFLEEDAARAQELAACPKNQAENVMIVDLLRNDLGKLALPGSVRVAELFAVERYPTVLQMVSAVEATLAADIGLYELFAALFPCGSVTGAPKASAMKIIHALEPAPRRAYCGAIGFVRPGGDCVFNVPIRTALLDERRGAARIYVGGGVVWDSTASGEYEECLAKLRFSTQRWTDFSLFETLLLENGRFFLRGRHVARMRNSAAYFGFPFAEDACNAALNAATAQRLRGLHRVKLHLGEDGRFSVQAAVHAPQAGARWKLGWAPAPVNEEDVFLFHKTTRRERYDDALAARPDCDDVLLFNTRGELTESCKANVALELDDELFTPARECGLLAGTFREELLQRGLLRERRILVDDVRRAQGVWLLNSLRRWIRVELAGEPPLRGGGSMSSGRNSRTS